MPETVLVLEDKEIIEIRSWGEVTKDQMQDSRDQALTAYLESGIHRVLVDAREQISVPTVSELFNFVESWRTELPSNMKIAIVPSPECKRDMRFVETVGLNRGSRVRVFDSLAEAGTWLEK